MSALLEVRDLRVNYGKVEAIHNIALSVEAGQIVTVIGPNGAGKTTSLAAIMGLLPAAGEIVFDGHAQRSPNVEKRVIQG
ncbi:MAG TPA: ATP-binding cassette domain-containing protein, partial [Azonexus sp.]|nr:ATP-binding cassette domain-containing protein [Azonexus sp.]